MQLPGGVQRGGGLGGVLLGLAQPGDRLSERGQPGQQHDRGQCRVFGEVGERGDQPGGAAQLVPGRGGGGDAGVGGAGGAVIGVSGLAEDAAAQRGGGHVQGVGGGPGGIGGGGRIGARQRPDISGGVLGGAGGVLPDRVPLRRGERVTRCGAGGGPPLAELGPGEVGRELAAAVPHRAAAVGGVAGQGDRVPGDLAGVPRAEPLAGQHPSAAEQSEELLLAARLGGCGGDIAAQRDPRGFVKATAGGLLMFGARRRLGAVRSAGAVDSSP